MGAGGKGEGIKGGSETDDSFHKQQKEQMAETQPRAQVLVMWPWTKQFPHL